MTNRKALRLDFEYQKRCCQKWYYDFFLAAWDVLEPQTELKLNWHIEYLCHELQKEVERIAEKASKDKDIIINVPPRSAKSYITSIMLCPWAWTRYPHLKFINASHSNVLSIDHCRRGRQLIESDWYQRFWSKIFSLTGDQNVKSFYENNKTGTRFAASVGSGVTGHGGDIIVADDLLNPIEALSQVKLEGTKDFYDRTLYSRLNDQDVGLRVVVMQRLHEDDITGYLLKTYPDKYKYICIPAELDKDAEVYPLEIKEYYKESLFFPDRFSSRILNSLKKNRKFYVGQYLQRPFEKEGHLFKRQNWRFYNILPERFDVMIQSWDASFKKTEKGSFVVGQLWGKVGVNYYLIAQIRDRMGAAQTAKMIVQMSLNYPKAYTKLIEDKANGPAIIDFFKSKISGLTGVNPEGSKEARAEAIVYLQEGGNVYLPNPERYSWVNDYLDELSIFYTPGYPNDQVDATSQALYYLSGGQNVIEKLRKLAEL